MKISIGIIGFGTIGRLVVDGALAHEEFDVVAVYDPALINNDVQFNKQYQSIEIMPSVAGLLALAHIDLIYIATPPSTHVEYCYQVLKANKALWCEKPLAVNLNEAKRLVTEVEASGVAAAVNLSLASSPALGALTAFMQERSQGRILKVEMRFHFSSWPRHWQAGASAWLSNREQGGFLREVFSHFVFIQHRLCGEMKLVNSNVSFSETNSCEDYVMASYRTGDIEIKVFGGVGGIAPEVNEWTLYTDERAIRFSDWNKVSIGSLEGWKELELDMSKGAVELQLNEVTKMLSGLPHKLASFREALLVQQIVESTLSMNTYSSSLG